MKKIIILFTIVIFSTLFVGCGKDNTTNNIKGEVKEKTKVSNISESYTKYTELKSKAYDKLSDSIPENDYTLSMGLLGFVTGDILIVPVSICGLSETEAAYSFGLFNIKDFKNDGNTCNMTFKDEDNNSSKFETIYDEKTDSIQMKMYDDNKVTAIYEYIKLDKGYATLQYYYDDDNNVSSYRSIFNDNYISVGFFENVNNKINSIYKSKSGINEEWTKGGTYWAEYDNGKFDSAIK